MTIHADGTSAKDIALHFINQTVGRATPAIMKKTVNQAKVLLQSGYTKEEVITVIDHIVHNTSIEMYSLGYVGVCINDVLKEIKKKDIDGTIKAQSEEIKRTLASIQEKERSEVIGDDESAKRNRSKIDRFGVKSRFGEKPFGDMPEGK